MSNKKGAILCILFGLLCLSVIANADDIRFAPLPMLDESVLRAQYAPLLALIEQRTDENISWHYKSEYTDIIRALQEDKLDLAYLGPLPYLQLTDKASQFVPLVRFLETSGNTSYRCVLVVFGGDEPLSTDEIQGKRIGLTQAESTCGHFAVSLMLDRAGRSLFGDDNQFRYTGGHDTVAKGVLDGSYDVAGMKEAIALRYQPLDLKIIDYAGPYPGMALVANTRTLSEQRRNRIRDALLNAGEAIKQLKPPFNAGIVTASDADYDTLRSDWHRMQNVREAR